VCVCVCVCVSVSVCVCVCVSSQCTVSVTVALLMPTMFVALQVNRKLLSSRLTLTSVMLMEWMVLLSRTRA